MSFAPRTTNFDTGDGSILGCFDEKDHGNLFEFSENRDDLAELLNINLEEFPHKVWVGRNLTGQYDFRYARVLKTVAYIAVDEDRFGNAIVEKWHIKNHTLYSQPK